MTLAVAGAADDGAEHGADRSADKSATARLRLIEQYTALLIDGAPLASLLQALTASLVEALAADATAVLLAGDDGHLAVVASSVADRPTGATVPAEAFSDDASSIATMAVERRELVVGRTDRLMPRAAAAGYHCCVGVPLTAAGQQALGALVAVLEHDAKPDPELVSGLREAARLATLGAQRDAAGRALRELASTDPLTGLVNRPVLVERIGAARVQQTRTGRPYGLIVLGIDGVAVINETLGHAAGDELLWMVAQRLRGVVGPDLTVARLWGDEFALLVEDLDGPEDAGRLAARVREAMAAPFETDGIDLVATASFGVAVAEAHAPAIDVLRAASTALDQAKTAGRAQIGLFAGEREANLAPDLRRGLADHEFSLAYQPIVRLADESLCGWEALLRWTSRLHGSVSPAAFVPVAEQSGLVSDLGRYALRGALAELARRRADPATGEATMAVNVSVSELANPALPTSLSILLAAHGVPHPALVLEVTENVLLRGGSAAWHVLHELQDSGVAIAVDDFGTGFSQLAYLRQFHFDELKIDRSFVADLVTDPTARAIVSNLIAMASDLGTPVVAEGVESVDQRDLLREFGATYAQGFLYGPALPPEPTVQ